MFVKFVTFSLREVMEITLIRPERVFQETNVGTQILFRS